MQTNALDRLTRVVTIMVIVHAAWVPCLLIGGMLFPTAYRAAVLPVAGWVDGTALLLLFATWILFARWIYVAGKNLVAAGFDDLTYTPASRIWWFFVPLLSFVEPFKGMRELYNVSHGDPDYQASSGLVAFWWGAWLVSNFAGYATRIGPAGFWISGVAGIVAAVAAIKLITSVNRAQSGIADQALAEVFA